MNKKYIVLAGLLVVMNNGMYGESSESVITVEKQISVALEDPLDEEGEYIADSEISGVIQPPVKRAFYKVMLERCGLYVLELLLVSHTFIKKRCVSLSCFMSKLIHKAS